MPVHVVAAEPLPSCLRRESEGADSLARISAGVSRRQTAVFKRFPASNAQHADVIEEQVEEESLEGLPPNVFFWDRETSCLPLLLSSQRAVGTFWLGMSFWAIAVYLYSS